MRNFVMTLLQALIYLHRVTPVLFRELFRNPPSTDLTQVKSVVNDFGDRTVTDL
jgi:hypothetical protein